MKVYHIVSRREPEVEPDYDIDVCTNCGTYFSWTKYHAERCLKAGISVSTQRCLRCIGS